MVQSEDDDVGPESDGRLGDALNEAPIPGAERAAAGHHPCRLGTRAAEARVVMPLGSRPLLDPDELHLDAEGAVPLAREADRSARRRIVQHDQEAAERATTLRIALRHESRILSVLLERSWHVSPPSGRRSAPGYMKVNQT